ncbi:MAG: DUF2207 domain-containing protein [Acidimicrobiia bacterium]
MLRRTVPTLVGAVCAALVVAACAALVVASAPPARAQDSEQIKSYTVDMTIRPDGKLAVVETIEYDFGSAFHHGIDRDIPVRFRYDSRFDRVYPLHVTSVTASGGAPAQYTTSSIAGGMTRIRVGDPDRTISGVHTYTIGYTVERALNGFADHDELYWNAVGGAWPVPISNVVVRVHAPATISRIACFAGPKGSSLSCDAATSSGTEATFTQGQLPPYSGLTAVVAIPPGAVPKPKPKLEERWSLDRAFERTPLTIGVSAGLLALMVGSISALAWRRGRDRQATGGAVDAAFASGGGPDERVPLLHHVETPVEFEPPDGIRPGEIGTLVDETANPLDVTATIVDLAVRGYLRIEEIEKEHWWGKADWKLTRLGMNDPLKAYERTLLDGLFEGGATEVKLSELRQHFAARLAKVQAALYEDTVSQGWFLASPNSTRRAWHVLAIAMTVVGIGVTALLARFTHLGLLGLPVAVGGIVLLSASHRMPARTAKGTGVLRRVEGFRRFIESPTETGHAQFDERKNLFSEYLPYAIVFGCTEKWANAFATLGAQATDTAGWYVSNRPFEYMAFSHTMDSFTTTTAGTVAAATPSSSGGSGFGGGGFSGGGGGGGGGGSW